MSNYANSGVSIRCTYGTLNGTLQVPFSNIQLDGKPVASVMDNKPMINIMPCGMCRSLLNPTVASATAACLGVLTPMPCIPNTATSPWFPGKRDVIIGGKIAMLDSDKLLCAWGGVIQLAGPARTSASVGAVGIAGVTPVKKKVELCPLCGKPESEHRFISPGGGCSVGNDDQLGRNMIPSSQHPWSRVNGGGGIGAHHLIPAALVDDADKSKDWTIICKIYSYDINKKENGVYLPNKLDFACHLGVPLHFKNHGSGFGGDEYDKKTRRTITYNTRIEMELNTIKESYMVYDDQPCPREHEDKFVADMDKLGKKACDNIAIYHWTLTFDAINYKPDSPIGCGNATDISQKQEEIDQEQQHLGNKTEVNGFRLYKRNIKYIREVRDAMLQNYLTPCAHRRDHRYPGVNRNQSIRYGGTY